MLDYNIFTTIKANAKVQEMISHPCSEHLLALSTSAFAIISRMFSQGVKSNLARREPT